jgi:phytoene dehydrogenase-like protein
VAAPRVIVIGAGLAGLACALELRRAGAEPLVLEASDGVGGRVRTDEVEGFLLDRGFQVLLTAYPEARRLLDYRSLSLRRFFPGAVVRSEGRFRRLADPWRRPLAAVGGVLSGLVPPADALRIARLRARARRGSDSPERSTRARLRGEGLSETIVERFFRPFLGGVFLDPDLETSDRQLELVLRAFSSGAIAVPAAGMGEIPRQLAARLPSGSVHLGERVVALEPGGVRTADGGGARGDAVVVATDGTAARELAELPGELRWRGVTCLYFSAPSPPVPGPVLVLNGEGRGPVNNLCVMSEVSSRYAPPGQALVSATVLGIDDGDGDLEPRVRGHLTGWFGREVAGWRHLRTYRVERALPDQSPPTPQPSPRPARLRERVYVCGDHRADASIDGSMASGRAAAAAVLEDLGPWRS